MAQDQMTQLRDFATRYTAAWCSQDAASVAKFFAPDGSLTINGGTPSVGRTAITEAAQGFMTAFPDLKVYMDDLLEKQGKVIYKWTLEGTNSGPGGTGASPRTAGSHRRCAVMCPSTTARGRTHLLDTCGRRA
jgi:hypothetical protein